jgi:hypothetical protein
MRWPSVDHTDSKTTGCHKDLMLKRIFSTKKRILIATVVICVVASSQPAGAAPATQKKACSRALERQFAHRPRRPTTAPPEALTSILGVLQRRATPADQLPTEALTAIAPYSYSTIWPGSARLLDAVGDTRYFLIPGVYDPPPIPEVCVKLQSPRERRQAKGPQLESRGPVVALEAYSPEESGGIPYTASAIQAGTANDVALGRPGPTTAFYGLVPDDVASVTVTAGGAPPITVPVANNFFLAQIPVPYVGRPYTIMQWWYAADGTLIKTVSRTTVLHD